MSDQRQQLGLFRFPVNTPANIILSGDSIVMRFSIIVNENHATDLGCANGNKADLFLHCFTFSFPLFKSNFLEAKLKRPHVLISFPKPPKQKFYSESEAR